MERRLRFQWNPEVEKERPLERCARLFPHSRRLELISQQKEETDKQKKLLTKRKPPNPGTVEKKHKQKSASVSNEGDVFAKPSAPVRYLYSD